MISFINRPTQHFLTTTKQLTTRTTSTTTQTTLAIARQIPNSFVNALSHHAIGDNNVCLATARHQHDVYLAELRRHVPTLCLPAIESHPDCLFVEDTAVVIGNLAVVTRIGNVTRQGEVDSMKSVLGQLGVEVVDMRDSDCDNEFSGDLTYCDGGDVLCTGRHLFVGLSGRTNEKGFQLLKQVFGERMEVVAVPPVIQGVDVLHLKSAVTQIDEETILAPTGPLGDSLLKAMHVTEKGYTPIRLPNMLACNAVVVNGHVLAQDSDCKVSKERIEKACSERGLGLSFVDTSELAKKDAALTCCSVLLSL